MDSKHNVLFQVSLSNGETFFEGKGEYQEIPGQLSPWQRLNKYLAENKLFITSLSLYTKDGRTFNLPSAGKCPRFKFFAEAQKPIDFNFFRAISREMTFIGQEAKEVEISDWFTVAEAIYPDYKLQLWVDENNTRNSWVLAIESN
jgi:hypothetical protein